MAGFAGGPGFTFACTIIGQEGKIEKAGHEEEEEAGAEMDDDRGIGFSQGCICLCETVPCHHVHTVSISVESLDLSNPAPLCVKVVSRQSSDERWI